MNVLEIKDLSVAFPSPGGDVHAVRDATLDVREGETLGLIGESGSGKSVIGLALLRLLPHNAVVKGEIRFRGTDILSLPPARMREMRGRRISLMPQNPALSLNPVLRNGLQLTEVYGLLGIPAGERGRMSVEMMGRLLLKDPPKIARSYPHQLSGGMKQRLLASIALSYRPELLLADEPTKGLDPEAKQRTIELFREIKKNYGRTMILITHDLDLALEICDRIAVLYSGEIVEVDTAAKIIGSPAHPYTKGLVGALPRNGLVPLDGQSPSRIRLPDGCLFHERCRDASANCRMDVPALRDHEGGKVRCHLY